MAVIRIKVKAGSKFLACMKQYEKEKKERFAKFFEQIKQQGLVDRASGNDCKS